MYIIFDHFLSSWQLSMPQNMHLLGSVYSTKWPLCVFSVQIKSFRLSELYVFQDSPLNLFCITSVTDWVGFIDCL